MVKKHPHFLPDKKVDYRFINNDQQSENEDSINCNVSIEKGKVLGTVKNLDYF